MLKLSLPYLLYHEGLDIEETLVQAMTNITKIISFIVAITVQQEIFGVQQFCGLFKIALVIKFRRKNLVEFW